MKRIAFHCRRASALSAVSSPLIDCCTAYASHDLTRDVVLCLSHFTSILIDNQDFAAFNVILFDDDRAVMNESYGRSLWSPRPPTLDPIRQFNHYVLKDLRIGIMNLRHVVS
jgi:hypothetical protein